MSSGGRIAINFRIVPTSINFFKLIVPRGSSQTQGVGKIKKEDINVENNFYDREDLIGLDYKVAGVVVGNKLQNLLNTYMNLSKNKIY